MSTVEEFYQSRRDLPDPAILLEEIRATSWRATAKKYGTTDTTIRRRLRTAGLVPQASDADASAA